MEHSNSLTLGNPVFSADETVVNLLTLYFSFIVVV